MGCDIHIYAEKKNDNGTFEAMTVPENLNNRSYRIFGWLAGVRNYSALVPISELRGFPDDVSRSIYSGHEEWDSDGHSASWLSIDELFAVDYDQIIEDRRCTRNNHGGCTCEPGEGNKMTLREFLGEWFMEALNELKENGADRIVFWFDN